jgi:4-hydroxythreonine-4-phosphate dehydrogenase
VSARPLAVSMGDPAGIGLEIAARAWAERDGATPPFYLVADPAAVARAAARAGISCQTVVITATADAVRTFESGLPVRSLSLAEVEKPGSPDTRNANATIHSIELAVADVRTGDAAAIVTLPIAKSVLYAARFRYPGHTEFVADLTRDMAHQQPRGPVMLLIAQRLRVALATIHAPLSAVAAQLSTQGIVQTARVVAHALVQDFGIARPRIVLAALNPHAGEDGTIGREEIEIINPAAAILRAEGLEVSDALPADTLFHADARDRHDAVIAMYHDQGLIPLKMLDFWGGVNITLGLPIVRTSPDHGTGFDIAGKGLARADSFKAALRTAADIAARRAAQP